MDMSNLKNVLQKLSVFKNNLPLLASVIIALVAVLLFLPTQLMSSKLKKDVEQKSITNGFKKIKQLESSDVSSRKSEMEAERQKLHSADANEVVRLAMQTTQRELLSYDIFPAPDPNGFSALIFQKFGENFRNGIDTMISEVKAGDCPTDAEIKRKLENSSSYNQMRGGGFSPMMSTSRYADYPGMDMRGGGIYGGGIYGGESPMMFGGLNRMIIDAICKERAKTISVYINPSNIAGYDYWADYVYDIKQEDAIEDCFYHQLAYWIIEDIFKTIKSMNTGYDSALTSPVKRFMGISFTMGLKSARRGGSGFIIRGIRGGSKQNQNKAKEADRPRYVRDETEGLSETCTGRYCNEDINVTHFNFSVIVNTKSVLPFMKELCSVKEHQFRGYPDPNDPVKTFQTIQTFKHNQITVLESKMGAIDPDDPTNIYYRYGDDPVVSLDLVCEYIFDVEGYKALTPEPVKKTLAGEDEEDKK